MPGCGMHSRPKLAEKARNNSLLKIVISGSGFSELKTSTFMVPHLHYPYLLR